MKKIKSNSFKPFTNSKIRIEAGGKFARSILVVIENVVQKSPEDTLYNNLHAFQYLKKFT